MQWLVQILPGSRSNNSGGVEMIPPLSFFLRNHIDTSVLLANIKTFSQASSSLSTMSSMLHDFARHSRHLFFLAALLAAHPAQCQTPEATIPAGTPLPVSIDDHLPMRAGQTIRAHLLYPVYVDNTLVLPENTVITGTVTELRPNRSQRNNARLKGDFTPFHIPVVSFTGITLPDGRSLPVVTSTATDGAPIYRLVAPPPARADSSTSNTTPACRYCMSR